MENKQSAQVLPQAFPNHIFWQILEGVFRFLGWIGVPHVLMTLNAFFKKNTRPLSPQEKALAKFVFKNSIDLEQVRVDDCSVVGCKRWHFAYVGFNFINSYGRLDASTLVHELVHVWQFQKIGVVYIPRALFAQRTANGYNYGGIEALRAARAMGKALTDFNYEQQGDIVADYFRLRVGLSPRWCDNDSRYLPDFEYFLEIFKD